MAYQLKADEILEALSACGVDGTEELTQRFEAVVQEMAEKLASHLGIECGEASAQGIAFAGTCVAFLPVEPGQPLPDIFAQYEFDSAEEWDADAVPFLSLDNMGQEFTCTACGRAEDECSAEPCSAVIADREA